MRLCAQLIGSGRAGVVTHLYVSGSTDCSFMSCKDERMCGKREVGGVESRGIEFFFFSSFSLFLTHLVVHHHLSRRNLRPPTLRRQRRQHRQRRHRCRGHQATRILAG